MTTDVIDDSSKTAPTRGRPSAAKSWLKAIELTSRIETHPQRLFTDIVEDWAKRQGDDPALISDTETYTYRAFSSRINQYARWALAAGIKPGDRVCLMMPAGPDYIAAWLGSICATLPSTETFKQKKQQLMHEGLDPGIAADPLYVRDPKSGAYRLLDHAVHAQLIDGFLRF